jgi:hypothetical protein
MTLMVPEEGPPNGEEDVGQNEESVESAETPLVEGDAEPGTSISLPETVRQRPQRDRRPPKYLEDYSK